MLVPLYGFLRGDSLGLVVLARQSDTIDQVAASLMQAASTRLPIRKKASVYFNGQRLNGSATVQQTGLSALDRIDVEAEDP